MKLPGSSNRTLTPATGARSAPLRLIENRAGAAAVEFALLLPVLALLIAGVIDTSRLISQSMQIRAAAQAGADWAQRHGWDAAGIQTAVTNATPLETVSATPSPQLTRACISDGAIVPTSAALCSPGVAAGEFVTVAAQAPFRSLAPWPGNVLPSVIEASAVVRVQ